MLSLDAGQQDHHFNLGTRKHKLDRHIHTGARHPVCQNGHFDGEFGNLVYIRLGHVTWYQITITRIEIGFLHVTDR